MSDVRHWTATLGVLALAALPSPTNAWGYEGHRVIAEIAQAYLRPEVKAKIDTLLAADTDPTSAHDLPSAATWADTWRNSHRETSQWHFVDIELDHPDLDAACFNHPQTAVPASGGPAQSCLIDRLKTFERELASPATPQAERIMALKFVLHFVGDLHQPLHASDNHDRGGNCVLLSLGGPRTVNLHSYWDTRVIDELEPDAERLADRLRAQITSSEKARWEKGDPTAWALETHRVAQDVTYTLNSAPGCEEGRPAVALPPTYEAQARQAIERQLERAGVRLAFVLNGAFG